jgi:glyoxylase-like metal-dependent hydrolase (beta-lactamase superfamily II)
MSAVTIEPMREKDGLKYPFPARPETGKTIELAPGIHWIRMPIPFQLNHINVWLVEDGEGWALVDTGINSGETKTVWAQAFAALGGRPVTRVIVTHLHPDHVGLAGWLCEKFDVPLYMTRTDYLLCRTLVMDTGQKAPPEGVRFYTAAGFGEEEIEGYKKRFGFFGLAVYRLPQSYNRLTDGQELTIGRDTWRIVVGRGHAPEHACLWCPSRKLLISGDQILPRISSNVSVFPTEPEANPLQDWLDSCQAFAALIPDDTLICPSHNEPFYGVKTRMTQLIDEHERGMANLLELCKEPKRAVDVFPALFKARITSGNYGMATGESIAHLNCLIARGHLKRTRDAASVDWYVTCAG